MALTTGRRKPEGELGMAMWESGPWKSKRMMMSAHLPQTGVLEGVTHTVAFSL